MTSHVLTIALTTYAVIWAGTATDYRRRHFYAQAKERAFGFGMSYAFEESAADLLKLLHQPTTEAVITFIQTLEQRCVHVKQFRSRRLDELHRMAYAFGASEAYRMCAEHLIEMLVEVMLATRMTIHYPC